MAFNTALGRAEYTASAAQTIFTFPFKIFNTSDVKVYLTPVGQTADDTTDILIETTDYTVTINGDNGGDVTLTSGATLNDAITLVRDLPVDRGIEYQHAGDLAAAALNEDQDYQTYLILDGSLKTNERALTIPESAQDFDVNLPAPGADKMFIYASDGKSINLIDPSNTDFFKEAFIVNSMQALLGVDETTYGSVNVRGYHTISDGGGDLFNWDSTVDKSTANAGTIIDPSVSLANQGTGVGTGCWIRQYSGGIKAKWFGAVCDGIVDDTISIQLALDLPMPSKTIIIDGVSLITGISIPSNTSVVGISPESGFVGTGTIDARFDNAENITIKNLTIGGSVILTAGADVSTAFAKNITISNIKIDTTATFPIVVVFIDNGLFEDITVTLNGSGDNTGFHIGNIKNSIIDNIHISGNVSSGISCAGTASLAVAAMDNCSVSNIYVNKDDGYTNFTGDHGLYFLGMNKTVVDNVHIIGTWTEVGTYSFKFRDSWDCSFSNIFADSVRVSADNNTIIYKDTLRNKFDNIVCLELQLFIYAGASIADLILSNIYVSTTFNSNVTDGPVALTGNVYIGNIGEIRLHGIEFKNATIDIPNMDTTTTYFSSTITANNSHFKNLVYAYNTNISLSNCKVDGLIRQDSPTGTWDVSLHNVYADGSFFANSFSTRIVTGDLSNVTFNADEDADVNGNPDVKKYRFVAFNNVVYDLLNL